MKCFPLKLFVLFFFICFGLSNSMYAQHRAVFKSSSSSSDDDDWKKILQNLNTIPSSGNDPDLLVAKVNQGDLTQKPLHLQSNLNHETRPSSINRAGNNSYAQQQRNNPAMAKRIPAPASNSSSNIMGYLSRERMASLRHNNNSLLLSPRQSVLEGKGSLLLKTPVEVNFVANEVVMQRSSATASFKVQKGHSYIVKIHTRMTPNRRSNGNVSLNVNYALGGGNTAINLSKPAVSRNMEAYEFQVLLLADGNGYINLDIQRTENAGRWAFSRVEIQQVDF